jgi:hypothetical protein
MNVPTTQKFRYFLIINVKSNAVVAFTKLVNLIKSSSGAQPLGVVYSDNELRTEAFRALCEGEVILQVC